jgi:hypothetical protein
MIRTKFQTPARAETDNRYSATEREIPLNPCGIGFCDFEEGVLGLFEEALWI